MKREKQTKKNYIFSVQLFFLGGGGRGGAKYTVDRSGLVFPHMCMTKNAKGTPKTNKMYAISKYVWTVLWT